jgi:hypothetical protein
MHLLLDEKRYEKIARRAARSGSSLAGVIREAIDLLSDHESDRIAALEAILQSPPIQVSDDPADLRCELDEMHSRHIGLYSDCS